MRTRRQDLLRAGVVWGLFALLLLAAVGVARLGGVAATLGERQTAGALSARLPAGWAVTTDRGVPKLLATAPLKDGGGGEERSLTVAVLPFADATEYFLHSHNDAFAGRSQAVPVAGRPGRMVETAYVMLLRGVGGVLGRDGRRGVDTIAAASLGDGRTLVVEMRRLTDAADEATASAVDEALVRAVARDARVEGVGAGS